MKQCLLAWGVWLGLASSASAGWQVDQVTDRMTDEVIKFAVADAKEQSGGIAGSLLLACDTATAKVLHIPAKLYAAIRLSEKMPVGATISWRVDDQPVRYQYMPEVRSTSMSAIHELSPDALRPAKRLRVQWTASTGTVLFYDFNVEGADKAMSQLPCGTRSPRDVR
jgi:hypothetical protein